MSFMPRLPTKTLFDHVSPTMIDLGVGAPSSDLLPADLMRDAATRAFSRGDSWKSLQYGPVSGDSEFLYVLSRWLTEQYNDEVMSQNLVVTSGASQSLSNLLTIFTSPGTITTHVFFQDPTYHIAFRIFLDSGFKVSQFTRVPEDSEGIIISWLEEYLSTLPAPQISDTGKFSKVLYLVPTHSNPSTSTLSPPRRRALVELARKYNMIVICDDVYDILSFEARARPRRIVAYDIDSCSQTQGNIISNCTFSKIIAPGLRCGWLECAESLRHKIERSGVHVSGGSPAHLSTLLVLQLIRSHTLTFHVTNLKATLLTRLHTYLLPALDQYLIPLGCSYTIPGGGYFVWVQLPQGMSSRDLEAKLKKSETDVRVGYGWLFSASTLDEENGRSGHSDGFIRICFAYYDGPHLEEGIRRLGDGMRNLLEEK